MRRLLFGAVGVVIFGVVGGYVFIELPRLIMQRQQWPLGVRVMVVYVTASAMVVAAPARLRPWVALITFQAVGMAVIAVSHSPMLGTTWLQWLVAVAMISPWFILPGRVFLQGGKHWLEQRRTGQK